MESQIFLSSHFPMDLHLCINANVNVNIYCNMTHSQMLGKVESGGGPIFKVVLETLEPLVEC